MMRAPRTHGAPVDGEAIVGEFVAYEDRANPRREWLVADRSAVEYGHDQYTLRDALTGETEWSDLRQPGWTYVDFFHTADAQ